MIVMPTTGIVSMSFEPRRVDYLSPETGGRLGAVTAGFPLWRMQLRLGVTFDLADEEWSAFMLALRGSQRRFKAIDLRRRAPRATPQVEATSVWEQTIDADGNALLALGDLIPASVLSTKDYIGFRWDAAGSDPGSKDALALVRVVGSATTLGGQGIADGTGAATVMVEPPVPTIVPGDAEAYFYDAGCLMKLVPGNSQLGDSVLGDHTEQGGTIEAVQELIP